MKGFLLVLWRVEVDVADALPFAAAKERAHERCADAFAAVAGVDVEVADIGVCLAVEFCKNKARGMLAVFGDNSDAVTDDPLEVLTRHTVADALRLAEIGDKARNVCPFCATNCEIVLHADHPSEDSLIFI